MFNLQGQAEALAARIVLPGGGGLCRAARAILDISQEGLATAAGVSRRAVNEYEDDARNEGRRPTPKTVDIARALIELGAAVELGPCGSFAVAYEPPALAGLRATGLAAFAAVDARPEDRKSGIPWGFLLAVTDMRDAEPRLALWPAGTPLAALVDAVPRPLKVRPAVRMANLRLSPGTVRPEDFDGLPAPFTVGEPDRPLFRLVALATVRRRDRASLILAVR